MKLRGSRQRLAVHHKCEKEAGKHLLCSDLVQLQWVDPGGARCQEIAILENLSLSGVGLFTGVSVPEGTRVQLLANRAQLIGYVKQCVFRENGYVVGLELDAESKWAQETGGRNFRPSHLLDVSLLDLG